MKLQPTNRLGPKHRLSLLGVVIGILILCAAMAQTVQNWSRNSGALTPTNQGDRVGIGISSPEARVHIHETSAGATLDVVGAVPGMTLVPGAADLLLSKVHRVTGSGSQAAHARLSIRASTQGLVVAGAAEPVPAEGSLSVTSSAMGDKALTIHTLSPDMDLRFNTYGPVRRQPRRPQLFDPGRRTYERMRVTSDGKVGIGITDPQSALHVLSQSAEGWTARIQTIGPQGGGLLVDGSSLTGQGQLSFRVATRTTGAALSVDSPTGNVGIGTQKPARKLELAVGHQDGIRIASSGIPRLELRSQGRAQDRPAADWVLFTDPTDGDFGIYDQSAGRRRFTIDSSGDVEVGGSIRSRSGGVIFPDGTIQSTAQVQGPKGDRGARGEKGDRGSRGPKGDIGLRGPKGEKGDIGPTGPSDTFVLCLGNNRMCNCLPRGELITAQGGPCTVSVPSSDSVNGTCSASPTGSCCLCRLP